jgi:hypothetical protein
MERSSRYLRAHDGIGHQVFKLYQHAELPQLIHVAAKMPSIAVTAWTRVSAKGRPD